MPVARPTVSRHERLARSQAAGIQVPRYCPRTIPLHSTPHQRASRNVIIGFTSVSCPLSDDMCRGIITFGDVNWVGRCICFSKKWVVCRPWLALLSWYIFPYGSYRNLRYCGETPPLTAGPGHASVVLPRCRLTAVTIRQTSRGGASSRPVACPVPPATLGYLNCSPPVRMHSLLRYCMQTRVNCLSPGLPPLTTLDDLSLAWWPCT